MKKRLKSSIISQKTVNNGFPSNQYRFQPYRYLKNHSTKNTEKLKRFILISYVQGVFTHICRIWGQVGIIVALKPLHILSLLLSKPTDDINFAHQHNLVFQISCQDYNAVGMGETGRNVSVTSYLILLSLEPRSFKLLFHTSQDLLSCNHARVIMGTFSMAQLTFV